MFFWSKLQSERVDRERGRETDRQTDRYTHTERERDREREGLDFTPKQQLTNEEQTKLSHTHLNLNLNTKHTHITMADVGNLLGGIIFVLMGACCLGI